MVESGMDLFSRPLPRTAHFWLCSARGAWRKGLVGGVVGGRGAEEGRCETPITVTAAEVHLHSRVSTRSLHTHICLYEFLVA